MKIRVNLSNTKYEFDKYIKFDTNFSTVYFESLTKLFPNQQNCINKIIRYFTKVVLFL